MSTSLYIALISRGVRLCLLKQHPPTVLSQAPFYYQAQYENAVHVITLPFEMLIQLAQSITIDDNRLVFIHSTGRSGSTLASRIFAQIPGVINMSEPDVLTQLVAARFAQPDKQAELKILLDASMRLLCKTPAQTAWVDQRAQLGH